MKIVFTAEGWADYSHWVESDRRMLRRVNALIRDIERDPYSGIGKPERLRHYDTNTWSRRINQEHRLVYLVEGGHLHILAARYHYTA